MWCLPFAWKWGCLQLTNKLRSSSSYDKNSGLLPFKKFSLSSIYEKNWGLLPFKKLRLSSIYEKFGVFSIKKNWGHLPLWTKLRSSSIQKIEVVFHLQRNSGHLPFSKWGCLPIHYNTQPAELELGWACQYCIYPCTLVTGLWT